MKRIAIAFHPGEYVLDEMKARKRTQKQFADLLGITTIEVNDLIKGRRNITARLAIRIGEAFGISPEVFLGLQNLYDMYEVSKKKDEMKEIENISIKKHELALA